MAAVAHTFYSHVNFSVTKIRDKVAKLGNVFYSHVNFSVTKIECKGW